MRALRCVTATVVLVAALLVGVLASPTHAADPCVDRPDFRHITLLNTKGEIDHYLGIRGERTPNIPIDTYGLLHQDLSQARYAHFLYPICSGDQMRVVYVKPNQYHRARVWRCIVFGGQTSRVAS